MPEITKKTSMATLIRNYFKIAGETLVEFTQQYKALTEQDKLQLASAIARDMGLTENECSFGFVEY